MRFIYKFVTFFPFKVDELEKDLKSEKESLRISRIKDEAILKDLRKELDGSKQQCMELQVSECCCVW